MLELVHVLQYQILDLLARSGTTSRILARILHVASYSNSTAVVQLNLLVFEWVPKLYQVHLVAYCRSIRILAQLSTRSLDLDLHVVQL